MHESAYAKAALFRKAFLSAYETTPLTVLDVGSAVVDEHPSNRQAFTNSNWSYVGLDMEPGPNVDVAVAEPYDWSEIADASVDVVTCSQVFEHSEFVWILILEIARVLKTNGLALIVAPGAGLLHRYPVDCWRFYDDGLPALAKWADLKVLDARVQWLPVYGKGDMWRDAAIVLQRPERSPEEEARAAAKIDMVKAAHLGRPISLARYAGTAPARSVIAPQEPQAAFEAEEERRFRRQSVLSHKTRQASRKLRAAVRVLVRPWGHMVND